MFILLNYITSTYQNLNIEIDKYGDTLFFDTEKEAENYAKENCAWQYKAVKL